MANGELISMSERIIPGSKKLPDEIAETSGFERGLYFVSDKTPKSDIHVPCCVEGCPDSARVYECNIHAVIDKHGKEVPISEIDPEIAEKLLSLNQRTQKCLGHILLTVADSSGEEED